MFTFGRSSLVGSAVWILLAGFGQKLTLLLLDIWNH
jgi:hypothetical protein